MVSVTTMYSKHSLGTRNVRGAFTLVELLVVVGIIAVLIAIILPVLGKAREQAYRIKCAANLRAMGQALILYTQQYRYYPGAQCRDGGAMWVPRLRPFLGGNRDLFYCPSQDERCRWGDSGPQPVARVAGGEHLSVGYEVGEPLIHQWAYFSYGYNGNGVGQLEDGTWMGLGAGPHQMLPASRVRQPADMIAIADSNADGLGDYGIIGTSTAIPSLPGRIHNGGANVLFCDGHVTWYPQRELVIDLADYLTQGHRVRRWNFNHQANLVN